MPIRRLISITIFAASVWLAVRSRAGVSMLNPVLLLLAVLVAIVALAAAVFDLRLGKSRYEDSGFGMYAPVGIGLGKLGLLLFAAAPLLIAAKGIYRGVIPSIGSEPDISFSHAPLRFLVALFIWIAIGLGVLALSRLIGTSTQARGARRDGR
jgi:hypothetical protein